MACDALLTLAILKGSPAIASIAASAAPAAHAPTMLAEAVLVSSHTVADSGAVAVDAPPTKSVIPVLTAPWPTEELRRWPARLSSCW